LTKQTHSNWIMPLQDLDIFPKVREDHGRKTSISGTITVICISIMCFLFITQSLSYLSSPPKQRLRVDENRLPTNSDGFVDFNSLPKLKMYVDIEFPSLPCPVIDFEVIDSLKEKQIGAFSRIKLKRIGKDGKVIKTKPTPKESQETCGSCYGASAGCCNTCKDVKQAFKAKGKVPPPLATIKQCKSAVVDYNNIKDERCRIHGVVTVPPISGVVVISTGDSYGASMNTTDALGISINDFNLTHTIQTMYFGENDLGDRPIDGISKVQSQKGRYKGLYFFRAIREKKGSSEVYRTSVTHYDRYREGASGKFPGLYFYYDVSPIVVEYKRDVSFLHFLVELMAILGGVYSLGTLLDHITSSTFQKAVPKQLN